MFRNIVVAVLFACVFGGAAVQTAYAQYPPAIFADNVRHHSGEQGGLIVHLGCGSGHVTGSLKSSNNIVHGLDTRPEKIEDARSRLASRANQGPVSVDLWDGEHLPYADNLVNLIVIGGLADGWVESANNATDEELIRVLAPGGILMRMKDPQKWHEASDWDKIVKPWPDTIDQWTHYLHGPDGNPVADDTEVGPPNSLRWIGGPKWARHHDHMASLTSMVSAGGRLFYIIDEGSRASVQLPSDWKLVARDAFNGTILWKRDIPQWNTHQYPLKSGPAHLLRRLVAVDDKVFVTLGIDAPVSVLDAVSGETLNELSGSEFTREIIVSDDVAYFVADDSPSPLPDWDRVSTYVWENTRTANPDWGWHGEERKVLAYDVASGEQLWATDAPVAPCSLAADQDRILFHDGEKLIRLDHKSGETLWASEPEATSLPVHTNTGPRVVIYGDVVLLAPNNNKITGWSIEDGSLLWEQQQRASGHMSLKDLMVVSGRVWTGGIAQSNGDGIYSGYNPQSGELEQEFGPDLDVHWFHHRCYPAKASGDYILAARNGTEFIDLTTEHWEPHHWVRGGCIYGVMPANGLLYAPMDACGCQLEAKMNGLKALACVPIPSPEDENIPQLPRFEEGPAYGDVDAEDVVAASDWPTYRHDATRSGTSSTSVSSEDLGAEWKSELQGPLTAPTIAGGKLFVASKDAHQVHALDAESGELIWSFSAGGRVDSPPTYYRGLALFGSADGWVYALRASDGVLAWRFRGAPVDRRMIAYGQIESAWPVHGSVLVHDGVLYCTAGRNMYLEGGIHFLRLDPMTGELLGETVMDENDPISGEDMQLTYLHNTGGNNMPEAHSDILTCDGRNIWMRSQKIDFEGNRTELELVDVNEQPQADCHLFCQIGFLDDSYFFRSYWTYGRRVTGGYGGWMKAGRLVPSGRILCFDEDNVYGFGRKPEFMTNSSVLQYQLFSADRLVAEEAILQLNKTEREMNSRSPNKNANMSDWLLRHFYPAEDLTAVNFDWRQEQPSLTVRAMTVSADAVFAAGPPNYLDERQVYRNPGQPETEAALAEQVEALAGRRGARLWTLSKEDGSILQRYELDSPPVFDGMAAADGALFVCSMDGSVTRLSSGENTESLPTANDEPTSVIWGQPEDPSYLKPVENR